MSMVCRNSVVVAALLVNVSPIFLYYFLNNFQPTMKTYVFQVEMSCEGCAKAIGNVLTKFKDKGIPKFAVDLNAKTVEVESSMNVDEVMEILKKTGKTVNFLQEK